MAFALADWLVLGVYLVLVLAVGAVVSRRAPRGDDFFLAGRGMPMAAVAVSVLATALSAATFVGGPQQSYASNLTYFTANVGGLLAVVVVALVFVPAFYRHRVTSIYEVLGHTCGPVARTAASAMFMIGRVMASGARLYVVALPFALVAFGETTPGALVASIAIIAAAATAYTIAGGIRAVIWTDVLQAAVVVATVGIAAVVLWNRIPADAGAVASALGDAGKLRLIDLSLDPSRPYTLWTAVVGFTLFNLAAFGTDQDLAQRLLTCRSSRAGAWSIILANAMSWPVVLLFLVLGLLLHVFYRHPELMGTAAPAAAPDDSRRIFLEFILRELPAGLPGLMMAGLFAAAMSSMDSALNAMASTTVADFYRPWRRRREPGAPHGDRREMRVSRVAIAGWALVLAGFAGACIVWQESSGKTIITFALGVMVYAYGGLLGVFLAVLLTPRGNAASAVAALAAGFVTVLLTDEPLWPRWAPAAHLDFTLAFPWRMTAATAVAFAVCVAGRRRLRPPDPAAAP